MIKLNIPNMNQLAKEHFNIIYPKLEEQYNKYKSSPYIVLLQDKKRGLDKEFVTLILTGKISDMLSNNSKIDFLFKLSSLAYDAPLNIKKFLGIEKHDTKHSIKKFQNIRKQHVKIFSTKNESVGFDVDDYIKRHIDYYKTSNLFKAFIIDIQNKADKINEFMQEIFNYDHLIDEKYRHELLYDTGVTVCPYCNRQYITNYTSKDNKKMTTADLDHFYPQKYFPFLALSIYNFIPSCQICNSRMKSSYFPKIIYPYNEEFEGHAQFNINIDEDNIDIGYIIGESDNFEIDFKVTAMSDLRQKINASIKLFRLKDIYKTHKDYVQEVLTKKHAYTESRKKELQEMFGNIGLILEDKELDLLLYGNYIRHEDLCKRPLAKLTRDILKK